MTSPWPKPDYETKSVMCCLCFRNTVFDDLSKDESGCLVDVCKPCRKTEILYRMVLLGKTSKVSLMTGSRWYRLEDWQLYGLHWKHGIFDCFGIGPFVFWRVNYGA